MVTQSSRPVYSAKSRRLRAVVRARRRRSAQTPPNAWLDSGVPALIGGFAAAAAGGLGLAPAAGVAAAAGLGYTLLRMRNWQG